MPIANFSTPKSNFKKTEFIDLSQGLHFIRILTEQAVVHDTHYVRNLTIKCLGEECPVCQNNTRLRAENPREKNPSNIPGYSGRRQVAYVNVLDRTPTKVCPQCSTEVKRTNNMFPASCPKCNALLNTVQAQPLNKVKVLSKGKQFFDQVEFHNATVLDEATQTPIGINNYDLSVMVMGQKTPPVVSALPDRNDAVAVVEDTLFDLQKAIISLDADEIHQLLRGVRLSDIFAARGGRPSNTDTQPSEEVVNQMSDLFK